MLAPLWVLLGVIVYFLWGDYADWNPLGGPGLEIESMVIPEAVRAGEEFQVVFDYQVLRDCERRVELWFFRTPEDAVLIRSHSGSTSGAGTGPQRRDITLIVPSDTPPGKAWVRSMGKWHCNLLSSWRYVHDAPVTVLPPAIPPD